MTGRQGALRDRLQGAAGLLAGVLFAAGIAGAGRFANEEFPGPGAPPDNIRRYYRGSARAAHVNVSCQIAAIVAHAAFVAVSARVAARHRRHPRAVAAAVLAGGTASMAALAVSALVQGSLTVEREWSDAEVVATTRLVFLAGGPVHGVLSSVFTAGLTTAARDAGLVGPTAATLGWASALAGALTPLHAVWQPAGWLIPIGRFSGYLLSGIVGVRLMQSGEVEARHPAMRRARS